MNGVYWVSRKAFTPFLSVQYRSFYVAIEDTKANKSSFACLQTDILR